MKLYKFQEEDVKFLVDNRTALLAHECGVGKTPIFLMAAKSVKAKLILILCPASIKYDYPFRCGQWGYDPKQVFVITPQNALHYKNINEGVFVMNYDICFRKEVAKVFAKKLYDVLILDESHAVKNRKAKRTKAVFGSGGYLSRSKRAWFVTGTPMLNKPEELFTMLHNLCPERIAPYDNYMAFTTRYCGGHQGRWGWVADGATHRAELSKRLEGFMLRRERDVLPELSEKILRVIHLERTKEIEKELYQESGVRRDGTSDDPETQMSVRQKMGLAKLPEVIRYIKEQLEENPDEKLIIFAYHLAVVDALFKDFRVIGHMITGRDTAPQKQTAIKSFISDPNYRMLICQIDAAGTGIDGLQDVCHHAIFAEISYVPGINQQAMGRLHRNGQKHKTIFDFLTVSGSIDENILDQNIMKADNIKSILQDNLETFKFKKESMKMGMDEHASRIAEALERIADVLEREFDLSAHPAKTVADVSKNISTTEKKETRGRKLGSKNKEIKPDEAPTVFDAGEEPTGGQIGAPAAAVDPFAATDEPVTPKAETVPYDQFIWNTAKTIQEKIGAKDPSKINAVLGELNGILKKAFPKYQHVLMIKDAAEQMTVVKVINVFMLSKGF